jgi:hypothetical protein
MKRIGILFSLFFLISSCEDQYRTVDAKTLAATGPAHLSDILIKDTTNGFVFSRLQRDAGFGEVYNYYLPDSLKGKNFNIVFKCRARTNYAHSAASICVRAIDKEGKLLAWHGGNLRYHFTNINTWCEIKDSILFNLQGGYDPYYCLNVFTFLPGPTKEKFDIDSLQVQFKIKDQ